MIQNNNAHEMIEQLHNGLEIFMKYNCRELKINSVYYGVEADSIQVIGPDLDRLNNDDKNKLKENGWIYMKAGWKLELE